MTFRTQKIEYRILFDMVKNQFMAIDTTNEENVAFGKTIEKAVSKLNHSNQEANFVEIPDSINQQSRLCSFATDGSFFIYF